MKISIVILHFGKLSITQKCILSLRRFEKEKFSLIVVNNTETKVFKKNFPIMPDITVINNERNLGFAGGVNVGIRYALYKKAEAVLLLNNDTHITSPILSELSQVLTKDKRVGIVAPVIQFKKNNITINDIGGNVNTTFGRTSHTEVPQLTDMHKRNVDYVSGCCMLIKSNTIRSTGLFDDRFFLYYEDVDFCMRAKKKGYNIEVVPSISIYHELSKSAGKLSSLSIYHQLRSALLFGKKYSKTPLQYFFKLGFVSIQTALFLKTAPMQTIQALSAWKVAF